MKKMPPHVERILTDFLRPESLLKGDFGRNLLRDKDGEFHAAACPWKDEKEKDAMLAGLEKLADKVDADLSILICEAWHGVATSAEERASLVEKYGAVENWPGAMLKLLCMVEMPGDLWFGDAPITWQGGQRLIGMMNFRHVAPEEINLKNAGIVFGILKANRGAI